MFTWICPKCGNEVPPAYSECQRCAAAAAAAPPPQQPQPPAAAPQSPAAAPQPQFQPAPQPAYAHPAPEHKSTGLRDLLVTLGIAAALLGGGYFAWQRMERGDQPSAGKEAAATTEAKEHPLAKAIEVTGFRIREPKPGSAEVKFLVVNHSAADIADLKVQVALSAREGKQIASFPVTIKRIAPFGSTEAAVPVKIAMKAYELPDWQFLEAKLLVQAPE